MLDQSKVTQEFRLANVSCIIFGLWKIFSVLDIFNNFIKSFKKILIDDQIPKKLNK